MLNNLVPTDEVVAALGKLPTATIYEAAGKWGEVAANIRPIVDGLRLCGRAFTVNDAAARRELGYIGRISRADGLQSYGEPSG